ncbi:MAG: ABC transporter substrate-binding protein [Prevotella sp.]|nr:ABC transporter substrate-binding protein [Alistipes senegalensis]MCM1358458.1 ABC transporter substrate-binding protein [Prevotella sp.]MCM1474213.1 ABC transporter substrate-binding protein [Muribaculaceae bacterium]
MNKFKKIMVFSTLLVFSALSGCGNKNNNDKIKIAYLPITHALTVCELAEESDDIELVKYGSWTELMDALNTGRVDGASVLMELAMKSKEQGVNISAVALGHRDGNVIITSNEIENITDLKGKTFAIPHRQSSHNILLNEALTGAGMTIDDITITELSPTEMPSALAGGQIDGYCVAEPFGAKAVSMGIGKVLYSSEDLWKDSVCCGLVLTDKFMEKNPEKVENLIYAYKQAGTNLNLEKSKETAKKYLNQDDDVLDISLQWISYNNLDITKESYDALAEKAIEYNLSENPPAYEDFVK